jgi:hypothetical protein
MNEHRQKLFRNLYDAVNDMFNTWDNIEDIYVSDLMAIRKAQMKLWREFKEEWQKEGEK